MTLFCQHDRPAPSGGFRTAAGGRLALLVLLCLLAAGGCARRAVAPHGLEEARTAWETFQSNDADGEGFSATASLNLATASARRRVRLRIWGNTMGPVRLDLVAGIGVTAGMWREDAQGLLAYMPQAATAYRYPSGRQGLAGFGLPEVFSVRELALALCGRFSPLFPPSYDAVRLVPDTGFAYTFAKGREESRFGPDGPVSATSSDAAASPMELVLDRHGRPVSCSGGGANPWRLTISGWTEGAGNAPDVPDLVRLEWTRDGRKGRATLYVKQARFRPERWPDDALALALPPGTVLKTVRP